VEGKLKPGVAMRLYGIVLGVLFLFYLMGLFLGRDQLVEARPREVSLPIADTPLEEIEPELGFYQRLMGPSATESDPSSSEDEVAVIPEGVEAGPNAAEPSTMLPLDLLTVQVGAFTAEGDARSILIRLEAKGYASVVRAPSDRDPHYRVSVGEFRTEQEALGMEERLRKDGFLTYIKSIQVSSAAR